VGPVVDVVDHLEADATGRTVYHYVIADYLCRLVSGVARPGSDVDEVAVVAADGLEAYRVSDRVQDVVRRAMRLRAAVLDAE